MNLVSDKIGKSLTESSVEHKDKNSESNSDGNYQNSVIVSFFAGWPSDFFHFSNRFHEVFLDFVHRITFGFKNRPAGGC
jgi:hypothetical protein